MMKLKLAALLTAGAIAGLGGAALAQTQTPPAPKAQQARGPHHAAIDLNKDGTISKDEWMKAAAARFERFDVSKDGKISREEMRFGRFEERRHEGRGRGGHRRGPHGGPGFVPGHDGPEGPGGPGRHMGPPPPPPADGPAPVAPAPGK